MPAGEGHLKAQWRWLLGAAGALNVVLAAGFAFQWSWAVQLWPWETGRLSYLFIGAMLAAVAAGAIWIAVSGETASLTAGFLNLAVMLGGIAGYLLVSVPDYRGLGAAIGVLALVNVGLLVASRWLPVADSRPVPPLVRGSYVLFAGVLLAVGLALILGVDGVMPWPVEPPTSVVFGWVFVGDAFYFAHSAVWPRWNAARAQLWSFLAYDVVILGPLALHLTAVGSDLLPNLVVYLTVCVFSAVLGVHYLVLNPHTRGWGSPATVGPAAG